MRFKCLIQGGCRFEETKAEVLAPDKEHKTTRILIFSQCPWCLDTRATITSPEPGETRCTLPRRWLDNGVNDPKEAKV